MKLCVELLCARQYSTKSERHEKSIVRKVQRLEWYLSNVRSAFLLLFCLTIFKTTLDTVIAKMYVSTKLAAAIMVALAAVASAKLNYKIKLQRYAADGRCETGKIGRHHHLHNNKCKTFDDRNDNTFDAFSYHYERFSSFGGKWSDPTTKKEFEDDPCEVTAYADANCQGDSWSTLANEGGWDICHVLGFGAKSVSVTCGGDQVGDDD